MTDPSSGPATIPWTPTRLPIVLPPEPDEALDSWIEAYARRLRTTSVQFLAHLGLSGVRASQMLVSLRPAEQNILESATGVPGKVLQQMTLERFDGLAINIRPDTRGFALPPAWRRMAGSRYCPACLRETAGRWPLAWRLPWSFACGRHRALLVDACPSCQARPVPYGTGRAGVSRPGICTTPKTESRGFGDGRRCGHALTEVPVVVLQADGHVLNVQRHVDRYLYQPAVDTGSGWYGHPSKRALAELFVLARRALLALQGDRELPNAVRTIISECGGVLPPPLRFLDAEDARAVAIGTALAALARRPEEPDSDPVLEWIVQTDMGVRGENKTATLGSLLTPWRSIEPSLMARVLTVMDSRMLPGVRLRYATASPAPRPPTLSEESIRRRAAMVPAILWPSWSMRLLGMAGTSVRPYSFRNALSTMLLLPGTLMTYQELAAMLGPQTRQPAIGTIVGTFDERQLKPLLTALPQIAAALDTHGSPIDYGRRRHLVEHERPTLDRSAYEKICARHGWLCGGPIRLKLLEDYLIYQLTGARPDPPKGRLGHPPQETSRWNTLRYRMPSQLREFLAEQAQAFLARHHIDEPLQWEPPPHWAGTTTWAGPDPDCVDQQLFRELSLRGTDITDMAHALAMNPEHIRLYMDVTGITAPEHKEYKRPPRTAHQGILEPDKLRELYEDQRLSIEAIADLARCSVTVVRQAIAFAEITTRPAHRARTLQITREWLDHEYTTKGRTLYDIACELGTGRPRITKYAIEWGIPIRSKGHLPDPLAKPGIRGTLSPTLEAAFTGNQAVLRIRRIVVLPGHHSLRSAARAAGLSMGTLNSQLWQVEQAVGFKIIERTQPLLATASGEVFIRDAKRVLQQLDDYTASHGTKDTRGR